MLISSLRGLKRTIGPVKRGSRAAQAASEHRLYLLATLALTPAELQSAGR
jgi:hypothetical protein